MLKLNKNQIEALARKIADEKNKKNIEECDKFMDENVHKIMNKIKELDSKLTAGDIDFIQRLRTSSINFKSTETDIKKYYPAFVDLMTALGETCPTFRRADTCKIERDINILTVDAETLNDIIKHF